MDLSLRCSPHPGPHHPLPPWPSCWKFLLGLGEWATRAMSLNKQASVVCGFIIKFPRERRAEGWERGGSRGREGTAEGRWILGTSQFGGVPQASIETTCGTQEEVQDCSAKEESFRGLPGHLAGKSEVGPSQPRGLLPSSPLWRPSSKPLGHSCCCDPYPLWGGGSATQDWSRLAKSCCPPTLLRPVRPNLLHGPKDH